MYPARLNRLRKKTRMLCKCCGDTLEDTNRYLTRVGAKVYLSNICRPCKRMQMATIRQLRKIHHRPPIGAQCECCGRVDKLQLDHEHNGERAFRGWLCKSCNISLGFLGPAKVFKWLWPIWPRQKSGKYARGHRKWTRGT